MKSENQEMRHEALGFRFGTKGETLARLGGALTRARLCEQIILATTDWNSDRENAAADILARFAPATLAIRSSTTQEDGWDTSNAGAFLSITNVEAAASLVDVGA